MFGGGGGGGGVCVGGGALTLDVLRECVTGVYFSPLGALMTKHTHTDGGPCEEDGPSSSPVEEPEF